MSNIPAPGVAIKTSGVAEAANIYRKARAEDRKSEEDDAIEGSTKGFAQMLASAKKPPEATKEQAAETAANGQSLDLLAQAAAKERSAEAAAAASSLELLAQQAMAAADDKLPDWLQEGFSLQGLVGQTAQMEQARGLSATDAAAGLAAQNAASEHALINAHTAVLPAGTTAALSQPATTIQGAVQRDLIAVVAQGVEQAEEAVTLPASVEANPLEGALAPPAATKAGEKVVDRPESLKGWNAEPLRGERSVEGKIDLEGQWTAADRQSQPSETMQRVIGQMTQFLSASALPGLGGSRRQPGTADGRSDAADWDASMAAQSGNGSARLTDYAVAQAASAQQAQNGDASSPENQPNLAFWMNARQQRADMVLDRDGQSVRVQVTLDGNAAHITFRSDEQTTRSMLDASVAQLRDMLAAQGVELAGVQVNTQAGGRESGADTPANGRSAEGGRRVQVNLDDLMASTDTTARMPSMDSGRGLDVFA